MKKVVRLTEYDLTRIVRRVIKEQTQTKIQGDAMSFLQNSKSELNPSLGVKSVPECYRMIRDNQSLAMNYGASNNEIDDYLDYLGIYGKVPGTGIPIPYESSDLQKMSQILAGYGDGGHHGGNYKELGPIEYRTVDMKGVIYPTVEQIRASFTKKKGKSLFSALSKKITDSKEDIEKKNMIIKQLLNAYQTWIDCVNGKKTDIK